MKKIKFYGGPMHGLEESIPDEILDRRRYEVCERAFRFRRSPFMPMPKPVADTQVVDRTTYYFKLYTLAETTKAMAGVHKTTMVAVLEGAKLTYREMYDMERDMLKLPWEWDKEPSVIYEFEAWWEKQLHVRGVKKVRLC
jgi:hypothetical protein